MTRQEFNIFSESIRGKLLGMAERFIWRTGLAEGAEGIVQEALVTLWKLSEEGYPIRDAEALAVRITKNLAVAKYRKEKLKAQHLPEFDLEGGCSATERTDAGDRSIIKAKLFGDLTPTQRKYLELRNELGLSLDEIATITGKPKSSIKTSISTARRQMLEQINKQL